MMTMNKIEELRAAIAEGKASEVHSMLKDIKADIETGNVELVEYIASPIGLSTLHSELTESLGANRRLMQLRGRVPNAVHRAALFTQAMINSVGYLL